MEVYVKNSNGLLEETDLRELIVKQLDNLDAEIDVGSFSDGSCRWIEVIQTNKEETLQVTVGIEFKENLNEIERVKVYTAPIMKVVDNDNSKSLI